MGERHARFALAAVLGLAVMAASPKALADDEIDATSLRAERLAGDAFARASRGSYQEAVDLYLQANEAAPSAVLAFDIAWLYDKHLGAPALALAYYRRALAAPDMTPELAARAGERIAVLEAAAKASAAPVRVVAPPSKVDAKPGGGSWSPLRTWGLVAGGAGLVALGVGAAFAVVAKNKNDAAGQYCDGDRCTDARALSLTDEARTSATVADVAIVAGALCVATGVTLWILAPRRGSVDVSIRASSGAPSFVLGGTLP
jgi:tetratricopeptide (TPR) repeat protein